MKFGLRPITKIMANSFFIGRDGHWKSEQLHKVNTSEKNIFMVLKALLDENNAKREKERKREKQE